MNIIIQHLRFRDSEREARQDNQLNMRSNLFYLSVVLYMVKYSPAYYLGKEKSDEYFTDGKLFIIYFYFVFMSDNTYVNSKNI